MDVKLCITYCCSLVCSSVWAASTHQYSAVISAAWLVVAVIIFLVDVKVSYAKTKHISKY